MKKFALSSVAAAVMVAMSGAAVAADLVIDSDSDLTKVDATQSTFKGEDTAFKFSGHKFALTGSTINFDGARRGLSVYADKAANKETDLTVGTNDSNVTVNVNANQKESGHAIGVMVLRNPVENLAPQLTINGNNLVINVGNKGAGDARGIHVGSVTTDSKDPLATLTINSENTVINVTGKGETDGIVAMSQGQVYVNGNLSVKADKALLARGDAQIVINKAGNKTVQLNGDIDFNYDKKTSGTTADATVDVTLSNADSYWVGNATTSYGSGQPPEGYSDIKGLRLSLSNGAQWTPTVVTGTAGETSGLKDVPINDMTLNGGVINLTKELVEAGQSVDLQSVKGTGGTINTYVTKAKDGTESVGQINLMSVDSGDEAPAFNVVASNVNADTMSDKTLSTLGSAINVENGKAEDAKITATVNEGAVNGAVSQDFNAKGEAVGDKVEAKNTKLDAYSSVFTLGAVTWRHDMNDLTKRMGELRMSPNKVGSWVRVYGSELNYGAQNVTAKQNSVQVGGDYDLGNGWKVGGAFSYTDGNSTYHSGEADNKAYGFAAYGTWFAEDGQFVDLIAKYSRLSNDFTLGDMSGDYDNNAFSVSAEYGWHFRLNDVAFVEPQAELTYGRIMGDDFTTSNGVRMTQEDFDSLIGRLGVRAGFYFPKDRGTIYARASVLHDFQGEAESKATLVANAKTSSTLKDDLGGTWYEFGLGANFNLTDATYVYVDLERTNASKVVEDYRWNCGIRHAF